MNDVHVVVGGQFGSEGKGHVTAWLARQLHRPSVVRIGGPNAGHTVVDADMDDMEQTYRMRHVPVGFVNPEARLMIAPGSEIDETVLETEIQHLEKMGYTIRNRLFVDRSCTVILTRHKLEEAHLVREIGSTGKGIGAARADRIMRNADTFEQVNTQSGDVTGELVADLSIGFPVIIEGSQGYGLGLHTRFYPFTTSSDCRAIDALAACGLSPWSPHVRRVIPWVVLRTYPIRVAGNSGPLQGEIDFETLSRLMGRPVEPERTTVTNKIRRIGNWDPDLAREAIRANGVDVRVVLSFLDYWEPEAAGMHGYMPRTDPIFNNHIRPVEEELGCVVWAASTGPNSMLHFVPEGL